MPFPLPFPFALPPSPIAKLWDGQFSSVTESFFLSFIGAVLTIILETGLMLFVRIPQTPILEETYPLCN